MDVGIVKRKKNIFLAVVGIIMALKRSFGVSKC
jgi:hypothetical protein